MVATVSEVIPAGEWKSHQHHEGSVAAQSQLLQLSALCQRRSAGDLVLSVKWRPPSQCAAQQQGGVAFTS